MTTPAAFSGTAHTTLAKYTGLINQINNRVLEFNLFLARKHRLNLIDPRNDSTFSILSNGPTESQHWPGNGYAGMYVFGGYDQQQPSRLGAYFGRASARFIWKSIRDRLSPNRGTVYTMQGGTDVFSIEVIMVVPVIRPRSMAHALEDYVVGYGLEDIYVMNPIGSRPRV